MCWCLLFFTVSAMGLWALVWIWAENSIDNREIHYYWVVFALHQGLSFSSPQPTSEGTGGAQEVLRGQSQKSWPQLATEISHNGWHHAQYIKLGEEVSKGGMFKVVAFVFPSNCSVWWSPFPQLSWKFWNTCLPHGKQWINSLLCFAYVHSF